MKREYHSVEQNTESWHKLRCGRFTASVIDELFTKPRSKKDRESGVLSDTAKKCVRRVAYERFSGTPRPNLLQDLRSIQHGHMYEPVAAKWYSDFTGKTLSNLGFVSVGDYAGVSVDRIIEGGEGILEIKCPISYDIHRDNLEIRSGEDLKKAHRAYWHQVQMQLWAIEDAEYAHWASFYYKYMNDPENSERALHVVKVERDETLDFESLILSTLDYMHEREVMYASHSLYMNQFWNNDPLDDGFDF